MKIFLPFKIKDIGGTTIFAQKFKAGMESRGHKVTFEEPDEYDILFLTVQAPFKYLFQAKRRKKPIVQRLDGTYYWTVSGWKFPFYNLKAALIRHFFADYTVYQSEYSRFCANQFLGKKRLDPSVTIYNGVDTSLFSPEGEKANLRDNPNQNIFFTASDFRRKDQILPIIEALKIYSKKYGDNWKFFIAGVFRGELTGFEEKLKVFKNVQILGKIENAELPKYERSADVFLFTHLNPPCPNNILEAMGCGLPICGIADGAMPELIRSGQDGFILRAEGKAFWEDRIINPEEFALHIDKTAREHIRLGTNTVVRTLELFSLEMMLMRYEEVFSRFKVSI